MPGHSVLLVVAGTFILAFGWFGFNPGSTLAGTDLRISFVVVNAMLAGIIASLAALVTLIWFCAGVRVVQNEQPDHTNPR